MLDNTGKLSEWELSFTTTAEQGRTFLCITVRSRLCFRQESTYVMCRLDWGETFKDKYSNMSALTWLVFLSDSSWRIFYAQGTCNITFVAECKECTVRISLARSLQGHIRKRGKGLRLLREPLLLRPALLLPTFVRIFHTLLTLLPWRHNQQIRDICSRVLDNMVGGPLVVNQFSRATCRKWIWFCHMTANIVREYNFFATKWPGAIIITFKNGRIPCRN
jgi:hypothetical protein